MSWFYYLAIILIFGLLMGKVVSYLKLPRVTGYLIAGVLIGPFVLKLVPHEAIESLTIISEAALGFIAYNIGSSLNYNKLKNIGKGVIIIALFEALMATFVVTLAMKFIFGQTWEFSLAIGAIASATAPAATIMVLKQYKAKGPLVDTLIPVVAIDDAIAVIAFGISIAIAQIISKGSDGVSIMAFLNPFIEIWLGKEMLFPIFVVCIIVFNFYSRSMTQAIELVRNSAGLYSPYPFFKYWALVEGLLNLVASVVLAKTMKLGMYGIFLGTSISTFLTVYVLPWNVYKYVFNMSSKQYYIKHIKYTISSGLLAFITYNAANVFSINNVFIAFIIKCFICLIIPNILIVLVFRNTKEFKYLLNRFKIKDKLSKVLKLSA